MGVNWTSHTILGVKLNRNKCYTILQKSGCSHDLPDKSFEFCPKCGQHALIAEEGLLDCLEDPGDWPDGIDQCTSTDDEDYFVGRIISSVYYGKGKNISSMTAEMHNLLIFEETIRKILEPLGLWDKDQYKIWNVLHCSYRG